MQLFPVRKRRYILSFFYQTLLLVTLQTSLFSNHGAQTTSACDFSVNTSLPFFTLLPEFVCICPCLSKHSHSRTLLHMPMPIPRVVHLCQWSQLLSWCYLLITSHTNLLPQTSFVLPHVKDLELSLSYNSCKRMAKSLPRSYLFLRQAYEECLHWGTQVDILAVCSSTKGIQELAE